MNILFVNNSEINPLSSGIQRITSILTQAFTRQGITCYGANFETHTPSDHTLFPDTLKLDFSRQASQRLVGFIRKYGITRVIVQECMPLKKLGVVHRATAQIPGCRLLYCYHSAPEKEFVPPALSAEWFRLWHSPGKIQALKKVCIALLPGFLYSRLVRLKVRRDYSFIYRKADTVVLLSERYIAPFQKWINLRYPDTSKFAGIGNCLSFSENLPLADLEHKKKEVVIVSRLSDRAKRISNALKIWQLVEQSAAVPDWRLKILGNGPDEKYYHHLARRLGLKQVDFEGKQNPVPYYRQASVCMLTSAYEGFPMILTEAQQTGAVPIAFGTFATLYDIIEDEWNGIIVPPNDLQQFADRLIGLMTDKEKRDLLAFRALEDCRRFTVDNIVKQWLNILH